MIYIMYTFKLFLYFVMSFLIYILVKKEEKMSLKSIIICCILFCIYSYIITKYPYIMDKSLYALKFSSDIYESQVFRDSIGLWLVQKVLHIFTYNPIYLFISVSFIYIFLTLIAFNKYDIKNRKLFIFLLSLSGYYLFGFYMIKQSIAICMVSLAIAYLLKENKNKFYLYVIIATLFHESAFVVILLYLCLNCSDNKILRYLTYALALIFMVFFKQISSSIVKIMINIIPSLEDQFKYYISSNTIKVSYNFLTIFKGLPFYCITFFGIMNRKYYKQLISNYNFYVLCSFFTSISIILSFYMYWMFRFGLYFYFPTIIFASELITNTKNFKKKNFITLIIVFSMFFLLLKDLIQYYFYYGGL